MTQFKRMRLVPEEEYERIKFKEIRDYNPELNARVKSETKIEDILSSSTLSADEKIKLIQATVVPKKYEVKLANISSELDRPPPVQDSPPVPEEHHVENLEKAIHYLPASVRIKAEKLKDFLNDFDNISTNDKNELVIDGSPVEGSNMTDLLNHLYNPRKGLPPFALDTFIGALKDLNVPSRFISNRKIASKIKSHKFEPSYKYGRKKLSPQSGKGKVIAYGKFPYFTSKPRSKPKLKAKPFGLYK